MERVLTKMDSIIFSQQQNIRLMLASFLAGGHVLLEGVPGLGKTKMVKTMATLLGGQYKRIQFTPDMMPSDVTGNMIFNMKENRFETIKGPVFTNWLLADEINRTPPKTQAALLEAMEERQVTIHGETYPLPDPFFVIATQNPVEYEGTYRLPEAQLDRFFFKIIIDYPTLEGEKAILSSYTPYYEKAESKLEEIFSIDDLRSKRQELEKVVVEDSIIDYITSIIRRTRESNRIQLGASHVPVLLS